MGRLARTFIKLLVASVLGITAESIAFSLALFSRTVSPVQEDFFAWAMHRVGFYGLATLLTGACLFVTTCIIAVLAERVATIMRCSDFLVCRCCSVLSDAQRGRFLVCGARHHRTDRLAGRNAPAHDRGLCRRP